jgi:hypothetical protein
MLVYRYGLEMAWCMAINVTDLTDDVGFYNEVGWLGNEVGMG